MCCAHVLVFRRKTLPPKRRMKAQKELQSMRPEKAVSDKDGDGTSDKPPWCMTSHITKVQMKRLYEITIYIIDTYIDTIYMCINDAWHSTSTKLPNLDYSSLCHFSKSCENIELDAFLTCQFAEKAWRCDGAMPVVAKESCLGSVVRWSDWSVAAQTWRRSHLTCGVVHRFEA